MLVIDSTKIRKIKEARQAIDNLQSRLIRCEEQLDDLARGVEIAMISGQHNLCLGFIQDARQLLLDRVCQPEPEDMTTKFTIIEDDRDTVSSKSA